MNILQKAILTHVVDIHSISPDNDVTLSPPGALDSAGPFHYKKEKSA